MNSLEKPKVAILCGGKGTRLREETDTKPKPMVRIGEMPILWHIMKIYAHFGFKDFILCLGYKGEIVKQFFESELLDEEDWNVVFADTGLEAQTGARIKKIEQYIGEDKFFATYGDAVADVNIKRLLDFHNKQATKATLTAVHPHSKWGLVKSGKNGLIGEFVEKPYLYDYVNGGFFIFKKDMFDYLHDSDDCVLETSAFGRLVDEKQFSMYKHEGFWHSMDNYKDYLDLNKIWNSGNIPWKSW